jgi:hypothetical protein
VSGFQHDIAGGNGNLIADSLQSPNFVHGSVGWQVAKDGSAEFNNLTIRGTFFGNDYIVNAAGVFFYSSAPAAGNLIISIAPAAGTDSFGNTYPAGFMNQDASSGFAQAILNNGQISLSSPSGHTAGVTITSGGLVTGPIDLNGDTGEITASQLSPAVATLGVGQTKIEIFPSGDTAGATDIVNVNNALAAGAAVYLSPGGKYFIDAPIVPKTGSRIDGGMWWSASVNDNYSAGTGASGGALITMVPAFTGAAAINMTNAANTQLYGVDLSGFTIEGFSVGAGTIYGILVDGAWGACFLRGVCIHRPPADCIRFQTDATSGKIPDDWQVTNCKFSASRNGNGVYAAELADAWFTDCESSESKLDGWHINYGVNTRFTSCKGENNAGTGYHFTGIGAGETQFLTGCHSDLNSLDGFLFDNAGPSGGGLGSYVLTGCVSESDGQSSAVAGYAGFHANGCNSRVILTGCLASTNATGPQYGASQTGGSYGLAATGCFLQGATAATHDDGTNTHVLSNLVPVPF